MFIGTQFSILYTCNKHSHTHPEAHAHDKLAVARTCPLSPSATAPPPTICGEPPSQLQYNLWRASVAMHTLMHLVPPTLTSPPHATTNRPQPIPRLHPRLRSPSRQSPTSASTWGSPPLTSRLQSLSSACIDLSLTISPPHFLPPPPLSRPLRDSVSTRKTPPALPLGPAPSPSSRN